MHAALRNLEVIHAVSSHAEHGTLPALASVCRAFRSPALDVLWRDLLSVEPFVKCLPTDLFDKDHVWKLQKPLDNKMWDTLFKYTSRVHSITVKQTSHPSAIIGPLSLIMLSYPSAPEDVSSPFIAQSISQLHNLRTLRLWDLGNTGIDHIMQLQALRTLHLDLRILSAGERKSHLPFPGFHYLHYLRLNFGAFERAMDFLSSLQVVRSKEIELVFASQIVESSESVSTSLFQFLAILSKICDNEKLERLSLVGLRNIHTQLAVFMPLRAFRNLIELEVEKSCSTSISDKELCRLVRAWPRLQALKISCYIVIGTTAVPTFHGLLRLVRLCPSLTSLSLVIDATKLEGINLRSPGGGNFSTCLKDLTLGNSIISSPLNVALILSGLFPYLEQVNLDCWDTAPMNSSRSVLHKYLEMEKWESVNSFLHGFSIGGASGAVIGFWQTKLEWLYLM
ncbi:hypothetical protein BDR07DRAFT_1379756 [Suillus spraguei]|nr:hypothetical protein BDR07DRAFT_1379756 [Suillus spraguei]